MNSMIRKLMLSLLVIHVRCQDVDSGHAYGAAVGEEVRVRADGDLDMRLEAVNASVDQDMVILCSDYEIPKSDKNLYIVAFELEYPQPDYQHHMLVVGCKEPGIRSQRGSLKREVWNCDLTSNFANVDEYPVANNCLEDEKHTFYVSFDQSTGRESLIFPEGTGIPVGGDSGIDFLTLQIHYLYQQSLPGGMTGHPTIRVRLHAVDPVHDDTKKAGTLSVFGFNRMNPLSVGAFESPIPISDFAGNETVHPVAVDIHTHEAAISTTLWQIDAHGHRILLWSQDPQRERHYHSFKPGLTLGPADAFDLECTYYNNLTIVQKIGKNDMCNMYLAYYVDGQLPGIHRIYIGNRTDTDIERPNQGRGTLIKAIDYYYY